MMDIQRVKNRLAALEQYKERLESIMPKDLKSYLKSDIILRSAVERNLQLVSDTELDVLLLLYKGLELRLAGDDDSVLEKLKERLNANLIDRVKERRVLRNQLIHAYADSHYDKNVFEQASNLKDLLEFKREVTKLVEK